MFVNTIAIPYSLHASITSWSLIEPPGCITAFIPSFAAVSMLSLNGKNASDARTLPSNGRLNSFAF
jgi:hypothetical protein